MTQQNAEVQKGISFYLKELKRYIELVKEDPQKAYDTYGFTLINSINPVDRAYYKIKYGFEAYDSADYYNRGVYMLLENKYKESLDFFDKAIQINDRFPEALYNLAWTYEQLGDVEKSVKYWEEYLDFVEDDNEAEALEQHIEALQAKS